MERLRELREKRSLSLRDLAREAGVSAAAISRIEAGKVHAIPRTAKRLAVALGVEPEELYGD